MEADFLDVYFVIVVRVIMMMCVCMVNSSSLKKLESVSPCNNVLCVFFGYDKLNYFVVEPCHD